MIRKQLVKDNKKKNIYIFLLFIVVILAYHFLLREYIGDFREMFSPLMDTDTLGEALRKRYETWSSRVFIEAPLILLAHNNGVLLWKVCNVFVWIALALSLMYLTHYKNNVMLIGLILMYPVIDMASAGWIAIYINYLWPLTAGCIALVSLDKMYFGKKIYLCEAIGYLAFELFATNFETVGVMYGCILVWYAVHFCIDRRPKIKEIVFWMLQTLIAAGNVLFALTCPGNSARKQSNISYYIKDYVQWTKIDKFIMGVDTTMQGAVGSNILFLTFVLVLGIVCCYVLNNTFCKVMSGTLMTFVATRTIFKPIMAVYFPTYNDIFDAGTKVDATNYYRFSLYFPFIVYIVLICMVVLILLNVATNIRDGVKYAVVFVSGILTRITMGFSPTIYASSNRTYIFWDFAILFLTVAIVIENKEKIAGNCKMYSILKYSFLCLVCVAVVGNLMAINR